jgi:hypothetical protein
MNSATDAASRGARLNLKRDVRAVATAGAAFTVVTFVDVLFTDGAGFFTVFLVETADFLVAMNISLLI